MVFSRRIRSRAESIDGSEISLEVVKGIVMEALWVVFRVERLVRLM